MKLPLKDSIVTKMMVVVLGLYLLIATGGMLGHLWKEYRYQESIILQDLGDIEHAFKNGLAVSLWGFDEKALYASIEGMLQIPTVVGVKIINDKGLIIAIGGIFNNNGGTWSTGLHVNLSGLNNMGEAVDHGKFGNLEMYERAFAIDFNLEGKSILLGQATIYSNSSVIQRSMKWQVVMLTINALLVLLTFTITLIWAVNRYLRKPLVTLAAATEKVNLDNLDSFKVKVGLAGRNELTILAESFNSMINNLHQSMVKRMHAEKAMKTFQSAVTASTDAIGMATPEGVHYYQNKAFEQMFGTIGADPASAYVEPSVGREVLRTIMAGKQWNDEVRMYGSNGEKLDILLRAYAIYDEEGQVISLVGVHTDITERKKSERTIAEERERLAVTLRSIGDGVITTDTTGIVTMLNPVAENLTGWQHEDAVGKPIAEVFHITNEKTGEICENPVSKVMATGQIVGLANHTALIARNGTKKSIADSGAPIRDWTSNIIGVVLVFRDVTEKQRLEQEALKVRKLESVGVLAGGIAHDFNNILAAILGNINLALDYTDPNESTYSLLSEAEKASLRAKDLTQQLLTFSKGGEPVIKTTSIIDIITDSSSFVLRGSNVRCDTIFAPDLWPVDIDPGQISQVIQNIIINAAHAMPQGGVIDIHCENLSPRRDNRIPLVGDRYIVVTIKDQGIGIPEKIIDRIFDPYFSTKQTGNGLGLAICHSIISRHGGHIMVESEPGQGTTFTIHLAASNKTLSASFNQEITPAKQGQGKIMIMDDDEMVRNMAQAMLGRLGYEVELASDGKEAIRIYTKNLAVGTQANLIIMDLTIPGGIGGKNAVQEILRLHPEAKVIVSSGYSNDHIMANFKDYGFCAAIVKPYQLQELASTVRQFMD